MWPGQRPWRYGPRGRTGCPPGYRDARVGIAFVGAVAVHDVFQAIGDDERARHAGAHIERVLQQVAVVLDPSGQGHGHGDAHSQVGLGLRDDLIIIADEPSVPTIDPVDGVDVPILRRERQQGGHQKKEKE